MLTKTIVRSAVNPDVIRSKFRPGAFLVAEVGNYICRGDRSVDGGADGIEHNSVLANADGDFDIIVLEGVKPGQVTLRGGIVRGPCEVSLARLNFPIVADVSPDPEALPPVAGVDGDLATAELREHLIDGMKAAGIVVRD